MVHAFVRIGEAIVQIAEAEEEGLRPFGFYTHTDDVDAVYHRALAAGATSFLPPADQPFGDRLNFYLVGYGDSPSLEKKFQRKLDLPRTS